MAAQEPQNVYDDPEFHAAYADIPRSRFGLDGAPEWPEVRALLPGLDGADVVDLGCGFGAFARWASSHGVRSVHAIDLSERMLTQARAIGPDDQIIWERADLGNVDLRAGAYDLAYSALAVHYLADLRRFLDQVYGALRPGGRLVLTTEHPVYMAPSDPRWRDLDGRRVWPLDGYSVEGERVTDWLAPGVRKHHRTLGTTLNTLIDAGFTVSRVVEWRPSEAQVSDEPALAEEFDRPMFLLVAADRPRGTSNERSSSVGGRW